MGGHAQAGDLEQIRQQRYSERQEVERYKRNQIWPSACPTCFAGVGEACFTRNGKRAVRHIDRVTRA